MPNDIRTQAIVLRRTNYGESDRILNLITPEGKISALARGVRKEKSRLAGSIELFSVSDITVHQGRSQLSTLTGARVLRFYHNIISDLSSLELASECLRQIEKTAEQTDNPEYFSIIDQTLCGLNQKYSIELVRFWFEMQLLQAVGEEINLTCDVDGEELQPDYNYFWDAAEKALRAHPRGNISASNIKLARVCLNSKLSSVVRIQNTEPALIPLAPIIKSYQ